MNICKYVLAFLSLAFFAGCVERQKEKLHQEKLNGQLIVDSVLQRNLFDKLLRFTKGNVLGERLEDSIAFLILPVQAACPACRRKTIDSIDKYKDRLDDRHFVVIVGNGTKSINGFFKQQDKELPLAATNVAIDTLNYAVSNDLTASNPNIYYAFNGKVYLKVSCMPNTIKKDLLFFFRGLQN